VVDAKRAIMKGDLLKISKECPLDMANLMLEVKKEKKRCLTFFFKVLESRLASSSVICGYHIET
jgi:hypothetical protein